MATFSNKERRNFQNICHLSERGMLTLMRDALSARYDKVTATPAFIYAVGDIPVALVAHADTVFKAPPALDNFFYDQEKDVIWNPDGMGADDRAGIFAILQIIKKYKLKPHVVITTGEECGCIGAGKLIVHTPTFPADLKFMIQLDRRNHQDAVYYDCDNPEFEEFITQFGFKTEWGTLSDISLLAPTWKVAAVNLSVGYEDEHHVVERLHVNWLYETIDKVVQILEYVQKHEDVPFYKYIPALSSWSYNYRTLWYDYEDDWDVPPGFEHCYMCNHLEQSENMIPIWYPYRRKSYNMCLECFADVSDQIIWCRDCGRGMFLTKEEVAKISNVNNWICEDCKNGRFEGNTGTIQQSDSAQSGILYAGATHGKDFGGMENQQRLVHVQHQLTNLGISKSCNL